MTVLRDWIADLFSSSRFRFLASHVAERFKAAVLKTVEPRGSGGSNPSSSASPSSGLRRPRGPTGTPSRSAPRSGPEAGRPRPSEPDPRTAGKPSDRSLSVCTLRAGPRPASASERNGPR